MDKTWEDEYIESMEAVKFSGREKAKMVQFLVNADRESEDVIDMLEMKKSKINLPIRRLAIAGICVCALAAGTAGAHASGILTPVSEVFGNILHLNENTSELADKMGNSLGMSDSSAGVTITADAVLGDEHHYAIVFTLEKEDGTAFGSLMDNAPIDTWTFETSKLELEPFSLSGACGVNGYFEDSDPEDSSVQYICLVSDTDKVSHKEMTVTFSNLVYDDKNKEDFAQALEGDWKLSFPLDFPDSTAELQTGQHLQTDILNMVVKEAQISPIGFYVEFEDLDFDYADMIEGTENLEKEDAFSDTPIALEFSNGEKMDMTVNVATLATEEGKLKYTYTGIFDKIIPLDEIESICVGDITIEVNKSES